MKNQILKIVHVQIYEEEDTDFVSDSTLEMLYIDNKYIMSGDWYHDRINTKIEGFLECLKFIGIPFEIEKRQVNDDYDNWSDKKELD